VARGERGGDLGVGVGDLPASVLTAVIEVLMSAVTPACSAPIWSLAWRKRDASSEARDSTTWRAEASCGGLATSTKALRNCPAA
jgi:hypothetical protein